jgi:hypothetical protein
MRVLWILPGHAAVGCRAVAVLPVVTMAGRVRGMVALPV